MSESAPGFGRRLQVVTAGVHARALHTAGRLAVPPAGAAFGHQGVHEDRGELSPGKTPPPPSPEHVFRPLVLQLYLPFPFTDQACGRLR